MSRPTLRPWRILALFLCLLPLAACGGGSDPLAPLPADDAGEDAFAHPLLVEENAYAGALPNGAKALAPETFAAMLDRGELILASRRDLEAQAEKAEKAYADDLAEATSILAPEVLARLLARPEAGHDVKLLRNGNVKLRIGEGRTDDPDDDKWVVLMGNRQVVGNLLASRKATMTRDNQMAVYELMYASAPAELVRKHQFAHPDVVADWASDDLVKLNNDLVKALNEYGPIVPIGQLLRPDFWWEEEGAGSGGDIGGTARPNDLADDVGFPLKWYVTTVKDQAGRGTCTAFCITAAVETLVARDHLRWVNLSEQFLYNQAKLKWSPNQNDDGLWALPTINTMRQQDWKFPFEFRADYNPSRFRDDGVQAIPGHITLNPLLFIRSDWANASGSMLYGGPFVSDTTHQADAFATTIGMWAWWAFQDPAPAIAQDSGFGPKGLVNLTHADTTVSADFARSFVTVSKLPVCLGIAVPPSFDAAGPDGIVTYMGPNETSRGGHCVLVVGYVANADLPSGVPNAAGGGYFIVKNSWGTGFGDGGYVYLPEAWVEAYMSDMCAITTL